MAFVIFQNDAFADICVSTEILSGNKFVGPPLVLLLRPVTRISLSNYLNSYGYLFEAIITREDRLSIYILTHIHNFKIN